MKIKTATIILILITAFAFFLRVHGINYYSYGDEAYHVYNSLGIGSGQLPGNFHRLALFIFYIGFYAIGWLIGIFTSPSSFIETYFSHQHVFYFTGRFFEAFVGTACIPLIYLLGKKMFSHKTGLVAALFLAVAPSSVAISQIARGQALCMFLIIIAIYYSYKIIDRQKMIYYLLAGFSVGAAISIRFNAGIVLFPVLSFLWLAAGEPSGNEQSDAGSVGNRFKQFISSRGLWLLFLSLMGAFIISHPAILYKFSYYMKWHLSIISPVGSKGIYLGCEAANGWWYYLSSGFPVALSWPLYVVFIVGLFFAVTKISRRENLILVIFCLAYYLIMGKGGIVNPRYLFPIIPVCLLLGAEVLVNIFFRNSLGIAPARSSISRDNNSSGRGGDKLINQRGNITFLKYLLLTIIALMLCFPAARGVMSENRKALMKTTKMVAEEWIFDNIPPGTKIAVERMGYLGPDLKLTPVLDYWIYNLDKPDLEKLLRERIKDGQPAVALRYFINNPPEKKFYTTTISIREIIDTSALEEEGYEYIVTSPSVRATFELPLVQQNYSEHCASREKFYQWLEARGTLLKSFPPDKNTPGAEFRIYRIKQ